MPIGVAFKIKSCIVKPEMFDSSKLIEIVALVQLNLFLLNGNLICEYNQNKYYGYSCTLSVNQSMINDTNYAEILGEHLDKRTDGDVKNCDGEQASMEIFPPICKKFTALVQISFSGSGLKFIGTDSFNKCIHLATLYLNGNNLTRTLPGMFQHNALLNKLDFSANKINQLHSGTFNGLDTLESLDLHDNRIEVLHAEVFARLTSLKRLYLASNQISRFSPETFAQTINLELLNLRGNQLRRVNANAFGSLSRLREFHIAQNAVEEIEAKVFEKLSRVAFLYADGNLCINKIFSYVANISLEIIPFLSDCFVNWNERMCKFSTAGAYTCTLSGLELTTPDESFNEIQFQHTEGRSNQDVVKISATDSVINFLPGRLLGMFGHLKYLTLVSVRLRELSRHSLRNCSQLEVMDSSMNEIQTLYRETFTDCRNLERIILNCNQIASIEAETFAELSKLNLLDLSYNRLIEIPPAMPGSLSSLKSLYVSGNRIETLTSTSLQALGGLKVLRLDSNRIKALGPDALINVHALEELHLQHNLLAEIRPGTFQDVLKLKYLNLENNSIQSLRSNILGELFRLKYLDISGNGIRFIDEEVFNKVPNLEFLFANDNECLDSSFEFTEQGNPLLIKCFEKF